MLPRDGSLCLLCRHECHRGLLYWPVILRNLPHLGRTQGAGPGRTSVTFVFVNVGLGGTEEEPGGTSVRGNGTLFGQLQSELKRGAGCRDRPRKGAGPLHQARAHREFGRPLGDHCFMPECPIQHATAFSRGLGDGHDFKWRHRSGSGSPQTLRTSAEETLPGPSGVCTDAQGRDERNRSIRNAHCGPRSSANHLQNLSGIDSCRESR